MEHFIGQIILVGFNFAPPGWAFCHGQLLSIAENNALFSLLGTTYGGNGVNNFALPDLRARCAIGQGQGLGLSHYVIGEAGGEEAIMLTSAQMPLHTHKLNASETSGTGNNPKGAVIAKNEVTIARGNTVAGNAFVQGPVDLVTMSPQAIEPTGGSQPHDNMQPYLVMNYIIALQGIFPSRG